jgi:hypothetical protein
MARPAGADYRKLMIELGVEKIKQGLPVKILEITKELGISNALGHFYFNGQSELANASWRELFLSSVKEDFERLDQYGEATDWEGVAALVYEVFSPERTAVRQTHLRAIVQSFSDDELKSIMATSHQVTRDLWVEILNKYAERGVLKLRIPVDQIALMFVAAPFGITAIAGELDEDGRKQAYEAWLGTVRALTDPDFGD